MAKVHAYESSAIRVVYDPTRCIHAAECVRGLPSVFDPQSRPWIQPDSGNAHEIAAVISKCPTGALQYERLDGGAAEATPERNTVTIAPDGPLFLRGQIEVRDSDENLLAEGSRLALCRCGASKIKPLCDNSHREAGFVAPSSIPDPKIRQTEADDGRLLVVVAPQGPLILQGPMTVIDDAGKDRCEGTKTALCRCGASANKPFCDGTHSKIGFEG